MNIELACPYCSFSKKMSREKIPASTKWATCPRCQRRFEIFPSDQANTLAPAKATEKTGHKGSEEKIENESIREGTYWENRSELGLWQAIYQTIKGVLFSTDVFFRKLSFKGGIKEPLAFGILTGSVGVMFTVFWQFLMMSGAWFPVGELIGGQLTFGLIFLIAIVFIPIAIVIGLFISSGIWHLFLVLLGGANNGFEATFRVISYSQSVQVLALVPIIGGWVSGIWQIVIQIIGLKEIHETTYLKVILAIVIPIAVLVFLVIAAILFLVMFLGRQHMGQLL